MTRLLALFAAIFVTCSVLAAAVAYAGTPVSTPAGITVAVSGEMSAPAIVAKLCAKRQSLGLPCTPLPAILPVRLADNAASGPVLRPLVSTLSFVPSLWDAPFRPPRFRAA